MDAFNGDAIQAVFSPNRVAMIDGLGLIAGGMVAMSGVPKVLQRIRALRQGRAHFDEADLLRDSSQAIGNALWVAVGLNLGLVSITTFCGLQAILMASLIYMNLQARRLSHG